MMPTIRLGLSPAVGRSIIGITLLVLGAVTLIALSLPGQGRLTDWWRDSIVPFFGAGRFLLPFALLVAGWYVEWGPGKEAKAPWGRILLGLAVARQDKRRRAVQVTHAGERMRAALAASAHGERHATG